MKHVLLIIAVFSIMGLCSCKKDRVCECTRIHTDSSGDVTTNDPLSVTYKEVNKSDAKTICQTSTEVYVNSSGGTSTTVNDCQLK